MHQNTEQFLDQVRELEFMEPEIRELPDGTHSAADAAQAIGCPLGSIVKSIVFIADGEPVLVYTAGDHQVEETALADELGADIVRLAEPDEVKKHSGWSIGGVPPLGHEIGNCIIDPQLLEFDRVWGGAGTPESVAAFGPEEIKGVTGARKASVFK